MVVTVLKNWRVIGEFYGLNSKQNLKVYFIHNFSNIRPLEMWPNGGKGLKEFKGSLASFLALILNKIHARIQKFDST